MIDGGVWQAWSGLGGGQPEQCEREMAVSGDAFSALVEDAGVESADVGGLGGVLVFRGEPTLGGGGNAVAGPRRRQSCRTNARDW